MNASRSLLSRLIRKDISIDDEAMALVAEVRKTPWFGSKPKPKITPISTPRWGFITQFYMWYSSIHAGPPKITPND